MHVILKLVHLSSLRFDCTSQSGAESDGPEIAQVTQLGGRSSLLVRDDALP